MVKNNEETPALWQTIVALLFGPILQVAISLIDLALKPVPLVVYIPISILAAASAIATLLYVDFKKRAGMIQGHTEPLYPQWARITAWGVIFVMLFVTVELWIFKYKNTLGETILRADCTTLAESDQSDLAIRQVTAESSTNVMIIARATVKDWFQPFITIQKADVVPLAEKNEVPLIWNIGEGASDSQASVEVFNFRKPNKFNLDVRLRTSRPPMPAPCSVLDFSFDIRPPTVQMVELKEWHKYNWARVIDVVVLIAIVTRAIYAIKAGIHHEES